MTAGNLCIVVFGCDGDEGGNVGWPDASWHEIADFDFGTNAGPTLAAAWHIATGLEAGTITVTTTGSEISKACAYEIEDAANPAGFPPEIQTATGTSNQPNPPSITASVTGLDNLFIGAMSCDRQQVTGYPSNLPDNRIAEASTPGPGGADVAMASDELTQDTLDPNTFSINASDSWCALTIVVLPPITLLLSTSGTPISDDDTTGGKGLSAYGLLTNIAQAGLAPLDDDAISADLSIVAAATLMTATITESDTISQAIAKAFLSMAYVSHTATDKDLVAEAILRGTGRMSSSANGYPHETDFITTAALRGIGRMTKNVWIGNCDLDDLSQASLRGLAYFTSTLTDDDTLTDGFLRAQVPMTSPITDDDSLSQASLRGLAYFTATILDDDTISEANLVIVGAVTLMSALLSDDDSVSEAALRGLAYFTTTITESDSVSEAMLRGLAYFVATLTDEDSISQAAVLARMVMAATITDEDTITEAAAKIQALLGTTISDTDTLTEAALVGFLEMVAALTDDDTVTQAAMQARMLMTATIEEWPPGGGGGGPYATGIIMG